MANAVQLWEKTLQKLYKTGVESLSTGRVAVGILSEWSAMRIMVTAVDRLPLECDMPA